MKRLVAERGGSADRRLAWQRLGAKLLKLETQVMAQSALAFAFIEGSLVKALREGEELCCLTGNRIWGSCRVVCFAMQSRMLVHSKATSQKTGFFHLRTIF
jgi:hypothetical protein